MTRFDWHARYHQDALDGMLLLTLEERGAYNTLLDLMYARSGPVPDDERWLSGWLGCSIKKWRIIRATLLVKGKIHACEHLNQPALLNDRAAQEIESASCRRRVASESGARGGRKSSQAKAKHNEIKANVEATLVGSLKLKTGTETEHPQTPNLAKAAKPEASDDAVFDLAWKACTEPMRKRAGSKTRSLEEWRRAVRTVPAATLLEALRRYLKADPDVARTGGPSLQRWLRDRKWEAWLEGGEPAEPVTAEVLAWRRQHFRETGEWRGDWGEKPRGKAA